MVHQLIIVAGLPNECHDRFSRESRKRLAPNGHIIVKPVKWPSYDPRVTQEYIKDTYNYILKLPEGSEVSISILYVNYDTDNTKRFLESFFPFALVRPMAPIEPDTTRTVRDKNARLKDYQEYIENEMSVLKQRIPIVCRLTHVHNLTPLLLPRANFAGDAFSLMMRRLYESLGKHDDPAALLDTEVAAFLSRYPRVYPESKERYPKGQHCFSDGELYFKSPGHHRHGFFRPGRDLGHPLTCLLNARSRLGGCYSHNFHFDCEPVRGGLKRQYPNCHGEPTSPKESHINIAPNDYIIG